MSRYKELQEQIAVMQKQAEEARKQEAALAMSEIMAKMAEYGIAIKDIEHAIRARSRRKTSSGVAKYHNPATGEQWTGRGRKPGWLVQALEQGRPIEEFRIA